MIRKHKIVNSYEWWQISSQYNRCKQFISVRNAPVKYTSCVVKIVDLIHTFFFCICHNKYGSLKSWGFKWGQEHHCVHSRVISKRINFSLVTGEQRNVYSPVTWFWRKKRIWWSLFCSVFGGFESRQLWAVFILLNLVNVCINVNTQNCDDFLGRGSSNIFIKIDIYFLTSFRVSAFFGVTDNITSKILI